MPSIVISLQMPDPEPAQSRAPNKSAYSTPPRQPPVTKLTPEEKVRDAIDCIESGYDSHQDWLFLNKVYRMVEGKSSPRAKNLCNMIKPVLSKFGYHGVTTNYKGT